MSFWIEVTIGLRWQRMLDEGEIRLDAPNKTRYATFFNGMKPGDVVFHYLTAALTPPKLAEKRSCIFAISRIASNPQIIGNKIVAKCSNTSFLRRPIPRVGLEKLKRKSKELGKLLRVSMRRYLTKISESDFKSIIELYPQNRGVKKKFRKSKA